MEDVENMVKVTMGEIEKLLSTKTVIGDPVMVDGKTLIPLVSIGFGFGAGSGSGKEATKGEREGLGAGTGGGGGVRPVAVIVSDAAGVKIESIKGGLSSALERLGETIANGIMERRGGKSKKEESGQ
jgi:uncharacterized spore protein YtfJ